MKQINFREINSKNYVNGTLQGSSQKKKKKTDVVNSGTSEINSGVKYVAGSEIEKGKMYIDEERITTGLYFTIS